MKKLLFTLFTLVLFVSCSKDDNESSESITGYWTYVGAETNFVLNFSNDNKIYMALIEDRKIGELVYTGYFEIKENQIKIVEDSFADYSLFWLDYEIEYKNKKRYLSLFYEGNIVMTLVEYN